MLNNIIANIIDRMRWGYLLAFIILFSSYILIFYSSQQVLNQQQRILHTNSVINILDDLLAKTVEAESSFRGYIISGHHSFLSDYNRTPAQKDSIINVLKKQISDNAFQKRNLDSLKIIVEKKFAFMREQMIIFNNNGKKISDALQKRSYTGKVIMQNVHDLVMNLQREEKAAMDLQTNKVAQFSNFIKIINILSIIIAILLFFYSIISFNRESQAKKMADIKSVKFREELEKKVNELDKLNTELIELRSIEKFAATGRISRTIAHEIRNPLTNINLAAEHLKSEMPPGDETDMLFGMVTRNSNRINDLISDLLNSTKASHLSFEKAFINDLLDSSLTFAQDRIELKKIKVEKNYDDLVAPIMADVEKINIAFLNIIVNAVEAMDENIGLLILKTENKDSRCVVTITDNGKGMDKESLQKLFEPYFTTKEKGNGLGLTNTQNIILSHNASIHANSEEGVGTSFIITFNYA